MAMFTGKKVSRQGGIHIRPQLDEDMDAQVGREFWRWLRMVSRRGGCCEITSEYRLDPSGYVKLAIENDHRNSRFSR